MCMRVRACVCVRARARVRACVHVRLCTKWDMAPDVEEGPQLLMRDLLSR